MWYLEVFRAGMDLIHAAKDGEVTIEEVAEVLGKHFPQYFDDVLEEVREAGKDGHYSVGEVIKIMTAVVS